MQNILLPTFRLFYKGFPALRSSFLHFCNKKPSNIVKNYTCPRKTQFSLDKKKKNFKQKPPSSFVNKFQSLIMPSLSYG